MYIGGIDMYNQNYQENTQYSVNVCSNCGRRLTIEEDSLCNPRPVSTVPRIIYRK